ncbi:MAG: T9SS type A sorting domain-containing protein [Cytophagaceae bacterium]
MRTLVLLLLLCPAFIFAQTPSLVKDINTTADDNDQFRNFADLKGILIMQGKDVDHNTELWRTDGTAGSTYMIKDINPGKGSSNPQSFAQLDNYMYFFADDGGGYDLWKTDGTPAGTVKVHDIHSTYIDTYYASIVRSGQYIYYMIRAGTSSSEVWRSDGTPNGTELVKKFQHDNYATMGNLTAAGKNIFFTLSPDQLWKSDGTDAGTVLVKDKFFGQSLTYVNGMLYFTSFGLTLWRSDGTTPGTFQLVKTAVYSNLVGIGSTLYFCTADSTNKGVELYKTDGTIKGTVIARDVHPGPASSYPQGLFAHNNDLFFMAQDTNYNVNRINYSSFSLFKLNTLTSSMTTLKSKITQYGNMVTVKDEIFIPLNDGNTGLELWKTDGSSAGTSLVMDIAPGIASSISSNTYSYYQGDTYLTTVGNQIFFNARDASADGVSVWKSDGSHEGTKKVQKIIGGDLGSNPSNLTVFGEYLYFSVGNQLWRSNGQGDSTQVFKTMSSPSNTISKIISTGNIMFFVVDSLPKKSEIWRTDGTAQGTVLLKTISCNSHCGKGGCGYSTGVFEWTLFNNELYIAAFDSNAYALSSRGGGWSLFKSDGTPRGTVLLKKGIAPTGMVSFQGKLYFSGLDSYGRELWKTDGTIEGTSMAVDINTGNSGSYPMALTVMNEMLYFLATTQATGMELFRSDGTFGGTSVVRDISPGAPPSSPAYPTLDYYSPQNMLCKYKDMLLFKAIDPEHGLEVWRSDGTEKGTVMVKEIVPGTARLNNYFDLISWNGNVYFIDDRNSLYKTDGTSAGTGSVYDFNAEGKGVYLYTSDIFMAMTDKGILFNVSSQEYGVELWQSDGIQTQRLTDIAVGPPSSNISQLTFYKNDYFFSANDGIYGQELWRLNGVFRLPPANPDSIIVHSKDTTAVTGLMDAGAEEHYPTISPNPGNGVYYITFAEGTTVSYMATVYTPQGIPMKQVRINTYPYREVKLDISELPNGLYYLDLSESKKRRVKKIIKG